MGHLHGSVALAKNNGTLLGTGRAGDWERTTGEKGLFADWILSVTADEAPKARTRIFTRALLFTQLRYFELFFYKRQLPYTIVLYLATYNRN